VKVTNDFMKGFFWGIVFAIIWYLQADPVVDTLISQNS
jgi:hypothetical protein